MRSIFRGSAFQPARQLGSLRPAPILGTMLFAEERNTILSKIADGAERLTAVKKWIASRIDQDPMLLRTFGQQHIADNFWGYDELVDKDQWYVDQAVQILGEDLESWELDEETTSRIDEWATAIGIMQDAMNRYGQTPLTTQSGTVIPGTTAPPGGSIQPTSGGGRIQPGANVTDPSPSAGIKMKDVLIYGGLGLGAIALVLLIKNA